MTRKNQTAAAKFMLGALSVGLRVLSFTDARIKDDIRLLGDGFSFSVCIAGQGPYITLGAKGWHLHKLHTGKDDVDLAVVFKDVSGALPVLFDRVSVDQSFADRRMQVYGNMRDAAVLARIVRTANAYFFFLTRKIEGMSYDTGIL